MTLDRSSSGHLYVKSQVVDYQFRGQLLQDYNVLDFLIDTYEVDTSQDQYLKQSEKESLGTNTSNLESDQYTGSSSSAGRKPNPRSFYLKEHPKFNSKHRIIRSKGHRNLPNFIGKRFPQQDDQPYISPLH